MSPSKRSAVKRKVFGDHLEAAKAAAPYINKPKVFVRFGGGNALVAACEGVGNLFTADEIGRIGNQTIEHILKWLSFGYVVPVHYVAQDDRRVKVIDGNIAGVIF